MIKIAITVRMNKMKRPIKTEWPNLETSAFCLIQVFVPLGAVG